MKCQSYATNECLVKCANEAMYEIHYPEYDRFTLNSKAVLLVCETHMKKYKKHLKGLIVKKIEGDDEC